MKIPKFLRWLDLYMEEAICVISLVALSIVMMLQVILRYVFQSPVPWGEEFCRYCFIYSSMFGIGYCVRNEKMLRVDLMVKMLPGVFGKLLDILGDVFSLVFYVMMCYAAYKTTMKLFSLNQLTPALQIPTGYVYVSGVIGFALGAFRVVQKLVLRFMNHDQEGDK